MTNDAELLRRYTEEKSEPAFTELVQRHVNFVYACALRRIGNSHLAEEATQQVFVAVARSAGALMKREALGGWLYTTARNVSVQIVRSEQRRRLRESEVQIMNELPAAPVDDNAWQRLNPVLDEGMDHLSEADREAVLLRFFEGKSFLEVGAKLRLSENAARMRVDRALDRMRGILARRGVTSTTAALALALANQAGVAAPIGLAASVTGTVLALGTAAGSGVGFFATFTYMSTLKIVAGTVVVLVAAGTIASTFRHSSRSSNALAEPATQQAAGLESNSQGIAAVVENATRAARSSASGPSTSASVTAQIGPALVAPAKAVETDAARQARRDAKQEERRDAKTETNLLAKQEATQANRTARLREATIRRLTPLFQQLALTPEQQEKLVMLTMDQHESTIDSAAANADRGVDISKDGDAYWEGRTRLRAEYEAQAKAILGESGYQALLANDLRVGQEAVVEHLQKRLTPGGAQLSEAQAGQLLALLRERDTWRVDESVLQQASGFLSAPQMESLKTESVRQVEGPLKPAVQKAITQNLDGKTIPAKN